MTSFSSAKLKRLPSTLLRHLEEEEPEERGLVGAMTCFSSAITRATAATSRGGVA